MRKKNINLNEFIEELEVLIGKYKEENGSGNGLMTEIPPEDIFAYTPNKEGIGVVIDRNQYMQIGDIEIGSRPEIKHEQKSNWWHIDDIEFFH